MTSLKKLLLKLALTLPKARNWYSTLCSGDRLIGAPATEAKLRTALLNQVWKYAVVMLTQNITLLYRNNWWLRARTVGVRTRLKRIKPVAVRKKFIITLTHLPESVRVANRCLERARHFGMQDGMEIWPAVDKFQAERFFVKRGFTWRHTDENFALGKDPLPEMGCFASHYSLWEHCVELDEPVIVLEHDAIPVAPVPPLRFRHIILLSRLTYKLGSYEFSQIKNDPPREIFYPLNVLAAAHGYAITPEAAGILIDAARRELIVPADSFISKRHVDILYYHPYPVDFDYEFSTIDQRGLQCLPPEETWKHYKAP